MLEYNHLWWRAISFKNVLGVDAWLILFVRSNLVRYDRGRSSTSIQIVYDTHSLRFLWRLRGRPTDNPFIYTYIQSCLKLVKSWNQISRLAYVSSHLHASREVRSIHTNNVPTSTDSHRIWWGCINEDVPFVKMLPNSVKLPVLVLFTSLIMIVEVKVPLVSIFDGFFTSFILELRLPVARLRFMYARDLRI